MSNQEYQSNPYRVHWILNSISILLIYSYIKESLQFHPLITLIPTFLSILIWVYTPITKFKGILRLSYIIPCYFLLIFSIGFSKAIKNQGGYSGGLDDKKWIVKHRGVLQLAIYAIYSHFYLVAIHNRINHKNELQSDKNNSVYRDIMSALSAPVSICSGGACHSFYASTITSLLSSFSLPLALITPFLNLLVYALQIMGLVSLYSVKGFKYAPLWLFFSGFLVQFILQYTLVSSGLMISGVVWNIRKNKFTFGKPKSII